MDDIDFVHQLAELKKTSNYPVNANSFSQYWKNGWICYIDLLAFSNICKESKDTALNNIIRFHRVISNATNKIPGNLYQFTDCCFFISDSFIATIKFAIYVMNGCCTMNEIVFRTKKLVKAYFLLRPRITISYGNYINALEMNDKTLTLNLNKENFLLGSGIVYAYETEKESFSHAITVNLLHDNAPLDKDIFEIKGVSGLSKRGLLNWVKSFDKKKIFHFPWPFVNQIQENGGKIHIKSNSNDDFFKIVNHLLFTVQTMQTEFINTDAALSIAKHPLTLYRFILDLYKQSKGANKITVKMINELYKKLSGQDAY